MSYQSIIHELDPHINPAGVEASMRLQYGVLDHLSRETFREEIQIARASEAESPGFMKSAAESYGMAPDFDHWQNILEQAAQAAGHDSLQAILANAHDTAIVNRRQSAKELRDPKNPHIAPGWNALMAEEMITGMFFVTAAHQKDLRLHDDHHPGLSMEQAEQAAPGLTKAIQAAVKAHRPSERLHAALCAEIRDIASAIVQDMTPETLKGLMDTARANVETIAATEHSTA